MRKKILIFGHGYAPQFVDVNNQYTQLFDSEKYEVTVLYLVGEPNETIRQKHLADNVIFLNVPKKTLRGLKISVIKKLIPFCRKNKFDIVICHRYKPSFIMMCVSLFHKIPKLFFVMHELNTLSSIARKLGVAALTQKNMIFAGVSDAVRDNMRLDAWKVPKQRIITLYNMIDVNLTEKKLLNRDIAREKLNIAPATFLFGTLGRLVENKDQKTLIYAFALIKPFCPQAKLLILGEGPLEKDLKKQVNNLKLQNDVVFGGFLEEGFRYMKAFDTYISSSKQEAFGRVLLEAMIAQVPIIATRVHGVPEVLGNSSILVETANAKKLADEMLKAYNASQTELADWGKQGYQRVLNEFSQPKFNDIFWNLPINSEVAS